VVVSSSQCRMVVHGGAVLGAVTGSSKGAMAALRGGLTAAKMAAQWGQRAVEEERRLHGGGGCPI
jgi:hypothetical protein